MRHLSTMHQLQNFELVAEADDANMANFNPIIDINSRFGGGEHNPVSEDNRITNARDSDSGPLTYSSTQSITTLPKLSQTFPRAQSIL